MKIKQIVTAVRETIELGDSFDIELGNMLIQTGVVGFTRDGGVVVEADNKTLALLGLSGALFESVDSQVIVENSLDDAYELIQNLVRSKNNQQFFQIKDAPQGPVEKYVSDLLNEKYSEVANDNELNLERHRDAIAELVKNELADDVLDTDDDSYDPSLSYDDGNNKTIHETDDVNQRMAEGYWQDALKKTMAARAARTGKPFEKNPLSHDERGVYKGDKDLAGNPVPKKKSGVAEVSDNYDIKSGSGTEDDPFTAATWADIREFGYQMQIQSKRIGSPVHYLFNGVKYVATPESKGFIIKSGTGEIVKQGVAEGSRKAWMKHNNLVDLEKPSQGLENELDNLLRTYDPEERKKYQHGVKQRIKTQPMSGPKAQLPEQGVAEGADVEYVVVIRDEQGKRSIRVSALTPTDAKEKAEAQGYKVLKVKDPREANYFKEQGVSKGSLNEFASSDGDDGGDDGFSEETLKMLAAQWYNGNEDPQVERTLMAAGWEIGQDEGYDDTPGVFVVQIGDSDGNSYLSWPAHELKKGVMEGHADQQRKIFKKNGKPVGEVGIDRESSPGVGMYYIKHYASGKDLSGFGSFEEAVEELKHLIKQGVAEAKTDPTSTWVVYDRDKVKRFKTHNGAKAYAQQHGGKVASSAYYADKIQGKQGVSEAAKWRSDDLEGKTWRSPDWDDGDLSPSKIKIDRSGKDVDDSGDELTSRPGVWRGKADMAKRMTKKGVPTKSELAFQNNLKMRMRMQQKKGGLIGPQGILPEEQGVTEAEYQGRQVPLGKPMAGDVAKSKVYVKGPKGNVVKVNFGDKNMRIKKSNPKRRKSFRARHNCDNPGPRWRARYWSCRAW